METARRTYSLDEARALLPTIRALLVGLAVERRRQREAHAALHALLRDEADADRRQAAEEQVAAIRGGIGDLIDQLEAMGVELRDLDAGLIDIPTERDGQAAWFCWRLEDGDLGHWHTTREGFATRRPIDR